MSNVICARIHIVTIIRGNTSLTHVLYLVVGKAEMVCFLAYDRRLRHVSAVEVETAELRACSAPI